MSPSTSPIPLVWKRLELPPSPIGLVLSASDLSFTIFQVPIGFYANRIGKKRLLVASSVLSALFFPGLYGARGLIPLVVLMALLGVTVGAIFIRATALAAEVVAGKAQPMSMALFDASIDLSFIVMPLIVGLTTRFGESTPFLVCTIFLAGAGTLFQLTTGGIGRREDQTGC